MNDFDENSLIMRAKLRVGSQLRGKYTIDSVLGVGGMATVFAVTHKNGQKFALKLLHPELATGENIRKRFIAEGSAANAVNHDGVVQVFDNDVDESGSPFLLMELLCGVSVKSLAQMYNGPMPIRESLAIIVQLLNVLGAAHEQGIVHRDIKPSNLFVTDDGSLKVLDFGIAQVRETTLEYTATKTGATLGTPSFMSPEQARAKSGEIDQRTDIWAVGATLFTLLSGQYVHQGENFSHLRVVAATEPARSLASAAPDMPKQLVEVVDRALAFDKAQRFKTAEEMREAVLGMIHSLYGELPRKALMDIVRQCKEKHKQPGSSAIAPKHTEQDSPVESPSVPSGPSIGMTDLPNSNPGNRKWRLIGGGVALLLLFAVIWGWVIQSNETQEGEIAIRVTTDMMVPRDVAWLGWTIRAGEGQSIIKQGAISLSDWQDLPATLITLHPSGIEGSLKIDIVARRGGQSGKIVMEQEIPFTIPKTGVKELLIPIDLLCTRDVNFSKCPSGQQCQKGACVDVALTVAKKTASSDVCFNAAQCFASGTQITVPVEDPGLGACVIKKSPVINNGKHQNLALVINPDDVEPYGACRPGGLCFLPLDFGGQSGWQLIEKKGKVLGVRLPEAVCKGIQKNRFFGVAIVPTTKGCPLKFSQTPLCPDPNTCIVKTGICPTDLSPAWVGYECRSAASPQHMRTDLKTCFVRNSTPSNDGSQPGRWCCSSGEPTAEDPLVIDDMSGGPQVKWRSDDPRYIPGFWWTASDATDGIFEPPLTPEMFTYRTLPTPISMGHRRSFNRAACFQSNGFVGWYALMGLGFQLEKEALIPTTTDLSAYSGIRFWGYAPKSQPIWVQLSDRNTFTEDPRSTCNQNPKLGRCGDDFGIHSITLSPKWQSYEFKWSELAQSPHEWGQARFESFDVSHVYHLYFRALGRGPEQQTPGFEFCVSQIEFIK